MTKKDIFVSVIIPVYNAEKYLKHCLDSILNQTYKNIKLIISDDCSTDGTKKILKDYAQKDDRIELYLQEKNLGVVKNIEFLLKKVSSNLYMLSDQDDILVLLMQMTLFKIIHMKYSLSVFYSPRTGI